MILTISGPEFVFAFAAGQRAKAERAGKALEKVGYSEWTLRHSFYLNMGGFVLQPRDSEPFPLHWEHLVYLLKEGLLAYPDITTEEISDKSKANGIAKALACLQTGWFVMQCLSRVYRHLPLTALELTTIGYVWCTWAIYVQWLKKPLDVQLPTTLRIEASAREIRAFAGLPPSQSWNQTPLDFISTHPSSLTSEVQRFLNLRVDPRRKPLARIEDGAILEASSSTEVGIRAFVIVFYGAIHLFGWNLVFPTRAEGILWHIAAVVLFCSSVLLFISLIVSSVVKALHNLHIHKKKIGSGSLYDYWNYYSEKAVEAEGLPIEHKVFEDRVDVFMNAFFLPLTALFLPSRLYIIVEALASLRARPDGAFLAVQWTTFIPHL